MTQTDLEHVARCLTPVCRRRTQSSVQRFLSHLPSDSAQPLSFPAWQRLEIEMRVYMYKDLLEVSHSGIAEITANPEAFKVVAEEKPGLRICLFLENEQSFAASDKSFVHRLKYVAGGLRGMLIPNFMPLWNRAVMDGFRVEKIERSGGVYEFVFTRPTTVPDGSPAKPTLKATPSSIPTTHSTAC